MPIQNHKRRAKVCQHQMRLSSAPVQYHMIKWKRSEQINQPTSANEQKRLQVRHPTKKNESVLMQQQQQRGIHHTSGWATSTWQRMGTTDNRDHAAPCLRVTIVQDNLDTSISNEIGIALTAHTNSRKGSDCHRTFPNQMQRLQFEPSKDCKKNRLPTTADHFSTIHSSQLLNNEEYKYSIQSAVCSHLLYVGYGAG